MVGGRKSSYSTLGDHPSEEAFTCWIEEMVGGREAACRLARQGDQVGISSKLGNVLLHPSQSQVLVPKTLVARGIVSAKGEEAQRSEPIVDCDQKHIMHCPVHWHVS